MDCLFCQIVAKKIKADIVLENETVLAFRDIHPLAPVHVLIIPKKHIESMNDVMVEDKNILGDMFLAAVKLAKDLGIAEKGYKLLIRTGQHGGQEVPHIHLHLIGGARLSEGIGVIR